jgi:hypothetical protein
VTDLLLGSTLKNDKVGEAHLQQVMLGQMLREPEEDLEEEMKS